MADDSSKTKIFDDLSAAFARARMPGGEIDAVKFAEGGMMVALLYDRIFGVNTVSRRLKEDICGHSRAVIDAVNADPQRLQTCRQLVEVTVAEKGVQWARQTPNNGVLKLLWLKRALDFILRFVNYGLFHDRQSLKDAGRQAYAEVLKPYHGFIVSKVVTMAFALAPDRKGLVKALGFESLEACQAKLRSFLVDAEPMIRQINDLLVASNCDFPDKV